MQNGGNPRTTVQKSRPVRLVVRHSCCIKPVFQLAIFLREQAKSECDWVVLSVFVASQSSCFFLAKWKTGFN